jgi:glycosyltransferase involved in cell wall biosynthesis
MKVCFWGDIGRALTDNTSGGGELQIALLAKALSKCGHEVVILDYQTSEDFVTGDGIKVIKINGKNNGIPIIGTFFNILPQFYRTLLDQQADIYYGRIRDFRHIIVYWAARKLKAKFILGIASDLDVLDFFMRLKHHYLVNYTGLWGIINGIGIELVYPFLTRKSDLVLVQHEGQQAILSKKGIKSTIFPNLFAPEKVPSISNQNNKVFIHVGELQKRKGFIEFFEVVKKAPDHFFKVVGQPSGRSGFLFYEELKLLKNVKLLGRLSHTHTMKEIAESTALISTSPMEGFPNIFIESWACGVPVISLYVDPGGIIEKNDLGVVADGKMDILLNTLDTLSVDHEFKSRSQAYVENNHVLNSKRIKEIDDLFNRLLDVQQRPGRS